VVTIGSLPDSENRTDEQSEYKPSDDMPVATSACIHFGYLLPTDRSGVGASSETKMEAVGRRSSNPDQSESGIWCRFEDSRAGSCLESQSVDFLDLTVERDRQERENKSFREREAYCHLP
jgi:hypothetical protein